MAAAQQMQVQVMHRLPAVVARVNDDAVSLVEPVLTRQICCGSHQVSKKWFVFRHRLRL